MHIVQQIFAWLNPIDLRPPPLSTCSAHTDVTSMLICSILALNLATRNNLGVTFYEKIDYTDLRRITGKTFIVR